jgi:hypothetical protein
MKLFPIGMTIINWDKLIEILSRFKNQPTKQLDDNNIDVKTNIVPNYLFLLETFNSEQKESLPEKLGRANLVLSQVSISFFIQIDGDTLTNIILSSQLKQFTLGRCNDSEIYGIINGTLFEWKNAIIEGLNANKDMSRNQDINEEAMEFFEGVLKIFDTMKLDKLFSRYERVYYKGERFYLRHI